MDWQPREASVSGWLRSRAVGPPRRGLGARFVQPRPPSGLRSCMRGARQSRRCSNGGSGKSRSAGGERMASGGHDNLVGIDLGTTLSVIARLDKSGSAVTTPNRRGDPLTPSVVYWDGTTARVGETARIAAASDSSKAAVSVKREMGTSLYSRTVDGRRPRPARSSRRATPWPRRFAARPASTCSRRKDRSRNKCRKNGSRHAPS